MSSIKKTSSEVLSCKSPSLASGKCFFFKVSLVTLHYAKHLFKDGASFCYCAYVPRISGYSGFVRNLPTNTTIVLRGLKLCGKSRC